MTGRLVSMLDAQFSIASSPCVNGYTPESSSSPPPGEGDHCPQQTDRKTDQAVGTLLTRDENDCLSHLRGVNDGLISSDGDEAAQFGT